jgi:ABC-type amino acid transport substrate-binding protein
LPEQPDGFSLTAMRPATLIALAVVLSVAASLSVGGLVFGGRTAATRAESAFDRVLRTNTLRCGYYVYPPATYRDPNTGKLSGFSVDMMERIAARAGLKIDWVQEVGFGDWPAALQAKRFDLACTPMWPNTALGRGVAFTMPFFYAGIYAIGRKDETRFRTLDDLNNPDVTIAVQEGNEIYHLAHDAFPNAHLDAIAPNADGNLIAHDVLARKADVLLSDKNFLYEFGKTNPETLKLLVDTPVKMMPFTLAVGRGETELLHFVDNAIQEMILTGQVDMLLARWMKQPGVYHPVAPAWRE